MLVRFLLQVHLPLQLIEWEALLRRAVVAQSGADGHKQVDLERRELAQHLVVELVVVLHDFIRHKSSVT